MKPKQRKQGGSTEKRREEKTVRYTELIESSLRKKTFVYVSWRIVQTSFIGTRCSKTSNATVTSGLAVSVALFPIYPIAPHNRCSKVSTRGFSTFGLCALCHTRATDSSQVTEKYKIQNKTTTRKHTNTHRKKRETQREHVAC